MELAFGQKFTQINLRMLSNILTPKKLDPKQILLKQAINLFYQIDVVQDFDCQQQFRIISEIKISQQRFSNLLTQVIAKKTKKFLVNIVQIQRLQIAQLVKCMSSKVEVPEEQILSIQVQQPTSPSLFGKIQNRIIYIFCQMLQKIRLASCRLQKMLLWMISTHHWKCQFHGQYCVRQYMEGHLGKMIFLNWIVGNEKVRENLGKLFHRDGQFGAYQQRLKTEVNMWGNEMEAFLLQRTQHYLIDNNYNSKIIYNVCAKCYFHYFFLFQSVEDHQNLQQTKNKKKKNKKKKNKNKNNKISVQKQENQVKVQRQKSKSRKNSLLQKQQNSTSLSQQIDQQSKMIQQKCIQRLTNFLVDLKIDKQNRQQFRMPSINQLEENQIDKSSIRTKHLLKRVQQILYKSNKSK